MPQEPRPTNHLSGEKSPYLLQHLHNPVDWHPWGEEAFSLARKEDKPIFLSIGYATCHWCHVMERESFEDEETARLMNETFVNIKVDREELPEVDTLYMEFAQRMMGGSAGWPLNLILTPDLEPFFAATYLPRTNQLGLMGVQELVQKIREMWQGENRDNLVRQAGQIVAFFKEGRQLKGEELPEKALVDYAIELFYKLFDPVYGGIRGAPKFPVGYQVNFLISYAVLNQDGRASFLAERTLRMMSQGGLYDHLEGGFFRYSVDEKWLVPHFEKMLYDNAILADAYLQGWLYTRSNLYAKIVKETLQFILEEMRNPAGGFNSALDSETEGEEGKFYTWKKEEVESLLGKEAELFCRYFGITEKGQLSGRNVLHIPVDLPEFCSLGQLDSKEVEEAINKGKSLLKKVRDTRPKPFKDDKILCSWNGMMIHSMALAGRVFEKASYLDAAIHAANFIYTNMWDGSRLKRRWREGEVLHSSGLDDYAYLIKASLTLFETAGETRWLLFALQLTALLEKFYKLEGGAFFQAEKEHQNLIIRHCQFADGAEPSGNSIHCENLLRLYRITLDSRYLKQAEDILKAAANFVKAYAPGYSYHLMNIQRYYDEKAPLLVIALNEVEEHAEELRREIFTRYLPHRALLWKKEGDDKLVELIPPLKEQVPKEGRTTLYLCRQGACLKSASTLEEMRRVLRSL